ncbi:MAG TPA: hypothetical protein VIF83_06145 [Gemmatimonadaceae bacterium]|jgi:hypothetical protein
MPFQNGTTIMRLLRSIAVLVAVAIIARSRVADDGHDSLFELWCDLVKRGGRGDPAPAPSVFATWRRGYGDRVIACALRDVAERNPLSADLVNQVLYVRAQGAYIMAGDGA